MRRVPFALLAALAVAVAAATGLLAARATQGGAEPVVAANATGFDGALNPSDLPPAHFALHDQDGRAVSARSLRGRVVVLTFIYSHCTDTCPLTVQQIRGGLDRLGHDVPVVAVSVDPRGDTPRSARAFVAKQRMTGRMRFLLGTRAELAPVWHEFGVLPQRVDAEHSAYTMLLDRAGVPRVTFATDQLTPEALGHDLGVLARR